jgi:hypothetical protein
MMQPEVMDATPDTRDHIQVKTTLYTQSGKLVSGYDHDSVSFRKYCIVWKQELL